MPSDPGDRERRRALCVLGAGASALGTVVAVPAARLVFSTGGEGGSSERWVRAIAFDALADGEPRRVSLVADRRDAWTLEKNVELGAVWLRQRGRTVTAWSATCPHLGCAVDRSAAGEGFYCPCHDSSFDGEGRRLTGPSPRDLDTLATRVDGGIVFVGFQRYRQGSETKQPIG